MNSAQRRKLTAGVGLIAMLLGALMVLAPTGAGADEHLVVTPTPTPVIYDSNVHCGASTGKVPGLGFSNSIGFDGSAEDGAAGSGGVTYTTEVIGGVRYFDWESTTHPILAVIVKQASGAAVFNYPGGAMASQVYVATGNTTGVSHIDFCYSSQTPDPKGTLIIRKDVVPDPGENGPTFDFTVDGPDDFDYGVDDLADGQSDTSSVPPGQYVLSEIDPGPDYELDDISCTVDGQDIAESIGTSGAVTVDVADGSTVDCTFINVPVEPEPEDELTVVKSVTGGNAPSTWEFDFTLCNDDVVLAAVTQQEQVCDFTLGNGAEQKTSETFPGSYFEVTELDDDNLTTIDCRDEENQQVGQRDGSTVAVEFSGRVTCTFTNDFPGGGGFTPTPTTLPEVEAASLQVVKAVAGAGAPDTWAVDFEVIGASVDEAFGVDDVISSRSFNDVEPGVYEITEVLADGDAGVLTDVTCLDDGINEVLTDVTGDTATVVLADGDDVVCTFTNSYAAVLPDEVTTTTTTVVPATTAAPAPQVLGDVVTLPRTGNETRNLAGLGAVLLVLGAAMVVGSNRRVLKRS